MTAYLYQVEHRTSYRYDAPIHLSLNEAHLRPRATDYQHLLDHSLMIDPPPLRAHERPDFFLNSCLFFSIEKSHLALDILSTSTLEIIPRSFSSLPASLPWEQVLEILPRESFREVRQYHSDSPFIYKSANLADYARLSFSPGRPFLEAVQDLNTRIYQEFRYIPNSTTLTTSPEDVLKMRKGVCQDFAHLMIGGLRSLGFSARYVSGYIETISTPEKPKLVGADASHAWVSVFLPGMGWVDFDPTNNQLPTSQHLTVAWGRDYGDVIPIRGVYLGSAAQTIGVGVTVTRLKETGGENSVSY